MLYFVKRIKVWLSRVHLSRGFGVQSPWAYRFIRYVVNEHYPYYKYEELDAEITDIDRQTRKLCKFYFRLANFQQPHSFIDCYPDASSYMRYVVAGCQKTHYYKITKEVSDTDLTDIFANVGAFSFIRVPLVENYRMIIDKALDCLPSSSVLIVEDIKRNEEAKTFWSKLITDKRTGITFDLYFCGVVFLNKEMVKQDYIVNF